MSRTPSVDALLRRLREEQGRSLREAATELGMAASQLSRMERGERPVTAQVRRRLSTYYNVDEDLLELASGDVPADVVEILRTHPELVDRLRQEYGSGASASARLP